MSSSRLDSSVAVAPRTSIIPTIGGPYFALAILFAMNLLNYIDRYSFFAVGTQIQRDLHVDDFWYGVLSASFMIVYTLVSPLMGWLGDRYNRRQLLAGGVAVWSLATVGTAFSADFYHMFFWRALLGCRRGKLRRDRPRSHRGPVRDQQARPGDGRLLPGAAAGRSDRLHARRIRGPGMGVAQGVSRRGSARPAGRRGRALDSRPGPRSFRGYHPHRQSRTAPS